MNNHLETDQRIIKLRKLQKTQSFIDAQITEQQIAMVKCEITILGVLAKRAMIDEELKYWNDAYKQFEEKKEQLLMEKYGQISDSVSPQSKNDN